jgi:L-ascorbate metabolism protein UlaG (beta-lactamase superfamily)
MHTDAHTAAAPLQWPSMPGSDLRAFASVLDWLLRGDARLELDSGAMRDLDARRHGLPLPPGLSLRWLGTAGFAIGYQDHVLLIDPYLTRTSARDALFGRRALRTDPALIDRHVPSASAVLVGHTHFDHALDIPEIARRRGCKAYGSRSLAHLMGLHGLSDRAVEVEHGRCYEIGPFEVTFVDSLHSKLLLGRAIPGDGELTCDHLDGLHGGNYRCGQVYGIRIAVAGVTFFHLGSAELIEDRLPWREVDYLLLGIAGRSFSRDFTRRALSALSPRYVVPHHYDDFFRPLHAPLRFSFNVQFAGFVDEVASVSREFELRTLEPLQVIGG